MSIKTTPDFLWALFQQLRRRDFALGINDYEALQLALQEGFGWSSPEKLRHLCCALWAKSQREQEILEALFDQLQVPAWQLPALQGQPLEPSWPQPKTGHQTGKPPITEAIEPIRVTSAQEGLAPITLDGVELPKHRFIFVPQYPISYREVAQAWRRLRQPVRQGAPTELDIDATVTRRSRLGVASEVVLVPRRRNNACLLLLIDRQGSMCPFHGFIDQVAAAIQESSNLAKVAQFYFDDVPAEGADETILERLPNHQLFPTLDSVLGDIEPLIEGVLYDDPELLSSQPLQNVLEKHAIGASVVLISDAGAARGNYDTLRLLDTIAFLKALRSYTTRYVWLNPLPRRYWRHTTAAQIARHLPMFPLDKIAIHQAVNVLRGQPYLIEKPI